MDYYSEPSDNYRKTLLYPFLLRPFYAWAKDVYLRTKVPIYIPLSSIYDLSFGSKITAKLLGPLGLESRISSPIGGQNLREFGLNLVHQGLPKWIV